jgi:GTPase SAR1 family protein
MPSGAPHRPIRRPSSEVTQFIVISGIDGCGKTTLIQELRDRLEQEGLTTRYEWLRYNHRLVRPVHGLSRLVGLSRCYRTGNRSVWRHEFYRSRLFSSFYILLTWLDACLGRLFLAARLRSRGVDIVVCDRWVQDILVDLAVDTRRRHLLAGTWHSRFTRLLPPATRQYLIVRDSDRVASSRPDVLEDVSHSFRRKLYRRLERSPEVVVVDNNGTVRATVDAIFGDWKSWACRSSS